MARVITLLSASFQACTDAVHDVKFRTTALINLASILEKCDEQILPAVYAWVGASFNATPTQLGAITLGRAMMQALSSPLGGVAGHFMARSTVIAIGCWLWATMTSLFALTHSLAAAMPICAMNGVGLALVIPNVQSLTADYYHASSRGQAFGTLWLTISVGGMLGALYATNTAAHTPLGIEGWRFVFFSVALARQGARDGGRAGACGRSVVALCAALAQISVCACWRVAPANPPPLPRPACSTFSVLAGLLCYFFAHDPTFKRHKQEGGQRGLNGSSNGGAPEDSDGGDGGGGGESLGATLRRLVGEVVGVMKIPTFGIIIIQGIVGSVPYASLIFLTLYFQLMGMSNFDASLLVALYLAGGGVGGLLGGWIGDRAAGRFPDHGRIVATQFSVIVGVPFSLLLFKGLPMNGEPDTVWLYRAIITAFAILTAWPAPCCNNPAFAEIVPAAQRNLIYAFDRCFEGAMAACSAPLVGLLAQRWFGFSGASKVTGDTSLDTNNAKALGSALLAFTTIPWAFCFLMYSGLHLTYPRDRRRALERERAPPGQHEWQFDADEEALPLRGSQRHQDHDLTPTRRSPTRRGGSSIWQLDPRAQQQAGTQGAEPAAADDHAQPLRRASSDRLAKRGR